MSDLSNTTVVELKRLAKNAGIVGFSKMRKDELITKLTSATTVKQRKDISIQSSLSANEWLELVAELTGRQYVSMTPDALAKLVTLNVLKDATVRLSLPIKGLSKTQLIKQLYEYTTGSAAVMMEKEPKKQVETFHDSCMSASKQEIVDMAEALDIDVTGKTKAQLCVELERELEGSENVA
jgi:hypothetical protein